MSCCYVDELEGQRRELEARRAMLEERFKLRLATAQEFSVIHTHRLDRVRAAFAAQCGAAHRRNQNILDKVQKSNDAFSGEKSLSGSSRERLSRQTEHFLSVADKLYPAWQEQQLHRKASQLGAIEEERFVTEQRRKAARDRFEQEQALAAVISERRRRLAAARAQERNELALRKVRRDRSIAEDGAALKAALERVNDAGRAARQDVLTEVTGNHSRRRRRRRRRHRHHGDGGGGRMHRGNQSSSSSGSGSSDGGSRSRGSGGKGRGERHYVCTDDDDNDDDDDDDDDDEEHGEEEIGEMRGRTGVHGGEVGAVTHTKEGARVLGRKYAGFSNTSAGEQVEGRDCPAQERSQRAQRRTRGGGGGGEGGEAGGGANHVLQDVFCATGVQSPSSVADERGGRVLGKSHVAGEESERESAAVKPGDFAEDAIPHSRPLAAKKYGRGDPSTTTTAETDMGREEVRSSRRKKKPRDDTRRRDHRPSDNDSSPRTTPTTSPPPPPPPAAGTHGDSGGDRADDAHGRVTGRRKSFSEEKGLETAEFELPRPPKEKTGASSSPSSGGRRRVRSFSSSGGSGFGEVSPSPSAAAAAAAAGVETALSLFGGGRTTRGADSRKEATKEREKNPRAWAKEQDGVSEDDMVFAAAGESRGAAAAATVAITSSWSGEEDQAGDGKGTQGKMESTRANVPPPGLFSQAAEFDAGGGDDADRNKSCMSSGDTCRPVLSLEATARAVAALTAQIEVLAAQRSGSSASSPLSPSSIILEAYGSATVARSANRDAGVSGAEMTESAAAAAAAANTAAIPTDDTHSSSSPELGDFEMVTLCGAVLHLVSSRATEILPPEGLSGIVTAAKVRAQHRRGSKAHPGRVQLFDAIMNHAHRLRSATTAATAAAAAAAASGGGGGGGGGGVDSAAITGVFAPCFESIFVTDDAQPENDHEKKRGASNARRGSDRLRRKVAALFESTADPNGGARPKTGHNTLSVEASTVPVTAATGLTIRSSGDGGGSGGRDGGTPERKKLGGSGSGAGSVSTARSLYTHTEQQHQQKEQHQQQSHWESTTPAARASSSGVVLGGGRSAGNMRRKKGNRLDLSSMVGSMAEFSTATAHGRSLPEFENYESLEDMG